MSFATRVGIALLAGIGAGLLGFWVVWQTVWIVCDQHPGVSHDAWLLGGIFVPGIVVPFAVFRTISRANAKERAPRET
jgi:hypothetical protein